MSSGAIVPSIALTGPEKAAAFLLLAGKDAAVRLADYFSEDELRAIFSAAGKVESLSVDEVEMLVSEFHGQFNRSGLIKSPGSVESLFAGMKPGVDFSEFVTGVKKETHIEVGPSTWQQVADAGIDAIVEFVNEEHPQVGAFLLSQIDQSMVAQVIERLPSQLRNAIVLRLVDINRRPGALTEEIERLIVEHFIGKPEDTADTESVEKIASIVNELGKEQAEEIIGFLEQSDPEKAAQIKKWLFRFELVETLAQPDRAILFDGIAAEELAKALFNASDGLKQSVLSVLSQRNQRSVDAELADANYSEEAVVEAQRKIARLAVSLSREGRIKLTPGEPQSPGEPQPSGDGDGGTA